MAGGESVGGRARGGRRRRRAGPRVMDNLTRARRLRSQTTMRPARRPPRGRPAPSATGARCAADAGPPDHPRGGPRRASGDRALAGQRESSATPQTGVCPELRASGRGGADRGIPVSISSAVTSTATAASPGTSPGRGRRAAARARRAGVGPSPFRLKRSVNRSGAAPEIAGGARCLGVRIPIGCAGRRPERDELLAGSEPVTGQPDHVVARAFPAAAVIISRLSCIHEVCRPFLVIAVLPVFCER